MNTDEERLESTTERFRVSVAEIAAMYFSRISDGTVEWLLHDWSLWRFGQVSDEVFRRYLSRCSDSEFRLAIDSILDRKLAWIWQASETQRVGAEFEDNGIIGPLNGFPDDGGVVLTEAGDDLLDNVVDYLSDEPLHEPFAASHGILYCHEANPELCLQQDSTHHLAESVFTIYLSVREDLDLLLKYLNLVRDVTVTGIREVGKWCCNWDEIFECGTEVTVQTKRESIPVSNWQRITTAVDHGYEC